MGDVTIFLLAMLMGAVCTIIVLCIIFFIILVTGVPYKSKRKGLYALSRCKRYKNKIKEKQDELIFPRR